LKIRSLAKAVVETALNTITPDNSQLLLVRDKEELKAEIVMTDGAPGTISYDGSRLLTSMIKSICVGILQKVSL
jgi:hypothetical protein